MYRLIAVLLLSACVASPKTPEIGAFRKAGAPIYSSAVLQADRLEGRWVQVAGFGPEGCKPGGAEFSKTAQGMQIAYRLCGAGAAQGAGALKPVGPGRFAVPGQPGPWWVLWADGDYRTLVIGTPDGSLGYVLNRGRFPSDRLKAARDILEWNGYDLGQMVVY